MTEKKTSKKTTTPPSEGAQTIYIVPNPDLEKQELKVVDVLVPLVRYKLQVAAVVVLGLLLGIWASLRYGEVLYTDYIEYQYGPPLAFAEVNRTKSGGLVNDIKQLQAQYPDSFYPDLHLLRPQGLALAQDILEKHYPISKGASDLQLFSLFKDSGLITFSACQDCMVGVRMTLSTYNVKDTFEALTELNEFVQAQNQKAYVQLYQTQLNQGLRDFKAAEQTLLQGILHLDDYAFTPTGRGGNYYLKKDGVHYLLRVQADLGQDPAVRTFGVKAIQFTDFKSVGGQEASVHKEVENLIQVGGGQTKVLKALYERMIDLEQKNLTLQFQYKEMLATLAKLHAQVSEAKPDQLAPLKQALAEAQAKLLVQSETSNQVESQISLAQFKANMIYQEVEKIMSARFNLSTYPASRWVEFELKIPVENPRDQVMEDPKNSGSTLWRTTGPKRIVDLRDFHRGQQEKVADLLNLVDLIATYKNGLFSPLVMVKAPSLESTQVSFRFNFKKGKSTEIKQAKPLTFDDFKPIFYSKKILALFMFIAFLLAVPSVMLRVFLVRAKEQGQLEVFWTALRQSIKNWRL